MENGMEREKTKGRNVKTGPQAGLFSLVFAAAFQKGACNFLRAMLLLYSHLA